MSTDPNEIPLDEVSGVEERPQNRREWSGVLRSLVLPLLIVATIVGVLLYFERARNDGATSSGEFGIVALPDSANVTGETPSTDIGRAAPDFLLESPDGGTVRLSDLRGSAVLVNFWASWCEPCRQEMPEIVRVYDSRDGDGFVVVAVDLQEDAGTIRAFADEFGMEFPIAIDRSGQVGDAWRIGGPVEGIPASYFLDEDGIVRARVFGPMTDETLQENLELILP